MARSNLSFRRNSFDLLEEFENFDVEADDVNTTNPETTEDYGECFICMEQFDSDQCLRVRACTARHHCCRLCLAQHIRTEVKEYRLPLRCPMGGCASLLPEVKVKRFFSRIGLSEDEIANILRLKQKKKRELDRSWNFCPSPNCSGGHQTRSVQPLTVVCNECGRYFTAVYGRTLPPSQRNQATSAISADPILTLVNQGMLQLCPNCGAPSEKISGCEVVNCRNCYTTWAWRTNYLAQKSHSQLYQEEEWTQRDKQRYYLLVGVTVGLLYASKYLYHAERYFDSSIVFALAGQSFQEMYLRGGNQYISSHSVAIPFLYGLTQLIVGGGYLVRCGLNYFSVHSLDTPLFYGRCLLELCCAGLSLYLAYEHLPPLRRAIFVCRRSFSSFRSS